MSLSSLIVQREIATIREVEEALARQVLYGGDLATNLFEVARLDEAAVTPLLAESFGMTPAPVGELPAPLEGTKQLVPLELATARSMIPLGRSNNKLVLAVSEPLSKEAEDELSFALGVGIEQRIAPSFRVRQAIAREYGVPLERRVVRLLGRITGEDARRSSSLPPLLRDAPRSPEPPKPNAALPLHRNTEPMGKLPQTPPKHRDTLSGAALAPSPQITEVEPPPEPVPAIVQPAPPKFATEPPPTEVSPHPPQDHATNGASPAAAAPAPPAAPVPVVAAPAPAEPAPAPAEPKPPAPPPRPESEPPPTQVAPPSIEPEPLRSGPPAASARSRRRHGPLTRDAARLELEEAADRDAILQLFFDFARQYFDYAALFLVQSDLAEGRDAFGDGAGRERVAKIGVPLDLPSLLSRARDKKESVLAIPSNDGLDRVLMGDLDRPARGPVLVVPIVVRTRVVALLWGDSGDAGVDERAANEVNAFARDVGGMFERLIMRKKAGGKGERARSGRPEAIRPSTPAEPPSAEVVSPRAQSQPPPTATAVHRPPPVAPATTGLPGDPPPPPPNLFQVRRPSGRPIPREEPERDSEPRVVQASEPPAPPTTVDVRGQRARAEAHAANAPVPPPPTSSARDVTRGTQPPASQAVSVPAHRPPASRPSQHALPSVIVDVAVELGVLVERVLNGDDREAAEAELLRQGDAAMPAVMERFPGPITADPRRLEALVKGVAAGSSEPPIRVSECGPLLRLIAGQRRVALPFVLERVEDSDADCRFWSTFLLTELVYAEAVDRLVPRIFDTDARTRKVARLAARALVELAPSRIVEQLGEIAVATTQPMEKRMATIDLLGELREAKAVPVLASLLQDTDAALVAAAHVGLVTITRHDFGEDSRKWLTWWGAHASKHRIEWLIEALGHDDLALRNAAGEELKAITKEYFGFYGDLPKRERERAQQRYRDWWATEGRMRFYRG